MDSLGFYLRIFEGFHKEKVRMCRVLKSIGFGPYKDGVLVTASPPLDGRRYKIAEKEIEYLVLGPRYVGDSLSEIARRPVTVYVFLPLASKLDSRDSLPKQDLMNIGFAIATVEDPETLGEFKFSEVRPW